MADAEMRHYRLLRAASHEATLVRAAAETQPAHSGLSFSIVRALILGRKLPRVATLGSHEAPISTSTGLPVQWCLSPTRKLIAVADKKQGVRHSWTLSAFEAQPLSSCRQRLAGLKPHKHGEPCVWDANCHHRMRHSQWIGTHFRLLPTAAISRMSLVATETMR